MFGPETMAPCFRAPLPRANSLPSPQRSASRLPARTCTTPTPPRGLSLWTGRSRPAAPRANRGRHLMRWVPKWTYRRAAALRANPLRAGIAIGAALCGLNLLLLPAENVGHALPRWFTVIWALYYALGGILVLFGMLKPSPRVEAPGWFMLGTAMIALVILTVALIHVVSGGVLLFLSLAIAALYRAWST
jgi:hypothetical protein